MNELDYYKALKSLTVLYCEDEPDPRAQMEMILSDSVKELYVAKDGAEGLELFKTHRPDLIITDIKMPRVDGLTMAEEIRKIDSKVQIILLTAFDYKNFFQRAIDIGVSQYVIKPIGQNKLFMSINRTVETIMAQKKIDYQSMYIQNILDAQKNLVIVTDGKSIQAANQSFLHFFGYEKLQEIFVDKLKKLDGKIEIEHGVPLQGEDFVEEFKSTIEGKKLINILDEKGISTPFSCEVSKLNEIQGRFLISLTDLSNLEFVPVKEPQLEEKLEDKQFVLEDIIIDEELEDDFQEEMTDVIPVPAMDNRDNLTGYYTLDGFFDEVESFISQEGASYSFYIFSFSNFRIINKKHGFEFGDVVIKKLTKYFHDEFLFDSMFVRLCGVEFGILIKYDDHEKDNLKKSILAISKELTRVYKEYEEECNFENSHFRVSDKNIKELLPSIRFKHMSKEN